MNTPEPSTPPRDARAAAFILAAVAAGAVTLFAVAARHGLDLTDEGFYLNNFRHWDATPLFTLFGAYFQLPYRLLNESVWAMRMLGALLLIGTGAWCASELMRSHDRLVARPGSDPVAIAAAAAGVTAFNYYGGFIVPHTPSYNTLALICALAATALTMRTARALADARPLPAWPALALGGVISIGVANKFSAGALVAIVEAVIAAVILGPAPPWRRIGLALAVALAGFALNILVLVAVDPDIFVRFRQGLAIQLALLPRDPAAEYLRFASRELPHGVFEAARMLVWPTAFALAVLGLGRLLGRSGWLASVAVSGFVASAMYLGFVRHRGLRIEFLTLVAVALWAFWAFRRGPPAGRRDGVRGHALTGALLALPFACSFGTNNAMLEHMAMAGVFPSIVIVSALRSLRIERRLHAWAFVLSLSVVAAAPSEIFVRQWLNGADTYRLGAPLRLQTTPLPANPAGVATLVDARTARTVGDFLEITRDSGFQPGTAFLDFTGQTPGLVMLAGGRPIGAAWIAGGGPFRGDDAAALAVSMLSASELRAAWLISSEDSSTRIRSWRRIVEAKLGAFPYEEVGRMSLPDPSSSDKAVDITILVWRPRP